MIRNDEKREKKKKEKLRKRQSTQNSKCKNVYRKEAAGRDIERATPPRTTVDAAQHKSFRTNTEIPNERTRRREKEHPKCV